MFLVIESFKNIIYKGEDRNAACRAFRKAFLDALPVELWEDGRVLAYFEGLQEWAEDFDDYSLFV